MAETAPAAVAPAKSPGKAKKKQTKKAQKSDGPSIPKAITEVLAESKDRKGTSVAALKKSLGVKGLDVAKCNKRINATLGRMVAKGDLVQTRGVGASGSFKLAKPDAAAKAKPAKTKKPSGQKPATKVTKPKKAGATAASPAKKRSSKNFKKVAKPTPKKSKSASGAAKTAAKAKPKEKPAKKVTKKAAKAVSATAKVAKKPAPKKTKK
ncbi:histone H1-like [Syngnathoides biaculeatus]|uniref:histone H1-like n=1 Tax=Syngnathoides biaculeatus TaxID=300417 RepID=UPI002ADDEFE1|nr:histone H1-like [Syngnathoides biaculeatus]